LYHPPSLCGPFELRLKVPVDAAALSAHIERARSFLRDHDVDRGIAWNVAFCVHECCTNAILHSGSPADIEVQIRLDEESVTALVTDRGRGLDVTRCDPREPELLSDCGRGLYLIASLMDEFDIDVERGTRIRMTKRLADPRS
jgi:serine/threonine-protein kinase RsbW